MTTFTIDRAGKITALESKAGSQPRGSAGAERFSSLDEFAKRTRNWPLARLVAIWNGLPSLAPVHRFTDRKTAVARIWKAINLAEATNAHAAKRAPKAQNMVAVRRGTKKARVVAMLTRPKGATLRDITRATGWQEHSVRGFISGNLVKKMGLKVNSRRQFGEERRYQIVRAETILDSSRLVLTDYAFSRSRKVRLPDHKDL